eukprot:gene37448-50538_t
MTLQNLVTNYAGYTLWANQQLVNWLSTKSEGQLNQEVPSSFSSILKTLNHIWAVEAYWYAIITQQTDIDNRYAATDLKSDEVFQGLINRSNQLVNDIQLFTEIELNKELKVVSPWLEANQPRFEYLQQLVNHGTYHR